MSKVLIGTSGYDYPEWKGNFYPAELKRQDFLSYYSTVFNALELNFSFYSMPTAQRMLGFFERSEGKIEFSVKANKLLTHEVDNNWQKYALEFKNAINPLQEKNVLAAVLFQFPESFHYIPENRIYLSKLITEFSNFPVIIEFRRKEWIRDSVFEGLEKLKASLCFCDMPQLKNLPAMNLEQMNPFVGPNAYIRLHGRNANAWYAESLLAESKNGSARYNYDYSEKELEQFVPVINEIIATGKKAQVYFNNHPCGKGAKNARTLKEMLLSK